MRIFAWVNLSFNSHTDDTIVTLVIDGDSIETTPSHLFYTFEGRVTVSALALGDEILSLSGDFGIVESITTETRSQTMYDLTVEEVHTFAVGDGAWVVHNQNCPPYSISNVASDSLDINAASLSAIEPKEGAGWTGAFDMETRKFMAMPSDPSSTHLRGTNSPPLGIVQRQGGHGKVAQILVTELGVSLFEVETRFVGFSLSYTAERVLEIGWKSSNLNRGLNPYVFGNYVLEEYQNPIISDLISYLPDGFKIINP